MEKKVSLIILFVASSVFMLVNYGEMLFSSNDLMFMLGRDGLKNYYTYSYHIINDTEWFNFIGMNYPYGDSIFFTDGHPLLSNFLKFFGQYFDSINHYHVGVLNVILLLSIFVMFFVSYFLLVEFQIRPYLAALIAIGVTLLSPQIHRIYGGHLALSYAMALPLNVLFLIKYLKKELTYRYLFYLASVNSLWLFIHAYLGVICVLFSLLILLVKLCFEFKTRRLNGAFLKSFLLVLFPVFLFLAVSKGTDQHDNRTDNPSGFFNYNAELDDVLIPSHEPLRPILDELTNNKIKLKREAWSYVGVVSVGILIFLLVALVKRYGFKKNQPVLVYLGQNKLLKYTLFASLIMLLFSFAIPFRTFPILLDYIPFIKQFRATGRFTWPFHFVVLILSSLVVQYYYEKHRVNQKWLSILFVTIFVLMNIIEGFPYHQQISDLMGKQKNLFLEKNLPKHYAEALPYIDREKYQAIMTLPYYFQGSESFARPAKDLPLEASMIFAYHKNLPLINANLGRTSIWENKNLVQLISPNFYEKKVKNDFKSSKPILIIHSHDKLTESETYLLSQSKRLYRGDKLSLFEIEIDKLFGDNSVLYFSKYQESNRFMKAGFEVSETESFLMYESFESEKSDKVFRGRGGLQSVKKGTTIIKEFDKNIFVKGDEYDISVWMNNEEQDALNLWFRFLLEFYDESDKEWKELIRVFPDRAETINGNWSLVEMIFKCSKTDLKYRLSTIGKETSKANLYIDDLLIKTKGVKVFKLDSVNSELFYNNHQVKF